MLGIGNESLASSSLKSDGLGVLDMFDLQKFSTCHISSGTMTECSL